MRKLVRYTLQRKGISCTDLVVTDAMLSRFKNAMYDSFSHSDTHVAILDGVEDFDELKNDGFIFSRYIASEL